MTSHFQLLMRKNSRTWLLSYNLKPKSHHHKLYDEIYKKSLLKQKNMFQILYRYDWLYLYYIYLNLKLMFSFIFILLIEYSRKTLIYSRCMDKQKPTSFLRNYSPLVNWRLETLLNFAGFQPVIWATFWSKSCKSISGNIEWL